VYIKKWVDGKKVDEVAGGDSSIHGGAKNSVYLEKPTYHEPEYR
jgi:hypothetical protein